MRRRALIVAAVLLVAGLLAGPAAAQCVMCKTALTNSAEGRSIVESFNRAILMMVVAPYLVVAVVAGALLRRQLAQKAAVLAGQVRHRLRLLSRGASLRRST